MGGVGEEGEPFFQVPPPHLPLRRVRSTLLIASHRAVRESGRGDDYLRELSPEHRPAIVDAVAGTWIDADAALAHYRACEALGISSETQVEIGRNVGTQIRGTMAGTILGMSKGAGVTPWTVLAAFPRLWMRLFEGSAIVGWKVGPKEIRLDLVGCPLADVRYFRNALRGQCMGVLDLFCARSYAIPRGGNPAAGRYSLRVQWA